MKTNIRPNRGETDIFFTVLISVLSGIAVVGLIILCIQADKKWDKIEEQRKEIHTETIPLQSINASTRVRGSSFSYFTYGVGQINEKDYYVAYRVLEDGGKQLYKMPAESTVIYETLESDAQAYAEEDVNGYGTVKARRLYVPENSIEQKYDLSLE